MYSLSIDFISATGFVIESTEKQCLKINNMKYTTKGEGHGYGLTLVNKLLEEESDKLENEKSINRDTFTQTLKIKM